MFEKVIEELLEGFSRIPLPDLAPLCLRLQQRLRFPDMRLRLCC